ncbi:MAG: hypothetical protein KGV44_14825 [Flavobacteriaceae bacterium]|nr:hypothetical protein [Flavobacteriaceae bacterium]
MKQIFYLTTMVFLIISCSVENDDLMNAKELQSLNEGASLFGKWKLTKVIYPFTNKETIYKSKGITFTFQKNGKVVVSKDNEAFFKGIYPYRISDEKIAPTDKNTVKMVVIDRTKFTYKYEKGVLELSNAYVDGVIIYLTK